MRTRGRDTEPRNAEGIAWHIDEDGIGRIVLDRARAPNTLSERTACAFAQAVADLANGEPRALLLTGRGRVFCAGGDIDEFAANAASLAPLVSRILTALNPAILRLSELPVPVVTALNGPVGGAGIGLALCGDFAYAAASMKLRTGYAAIGLSPDAGASYFLARRAGELRARQLFFTSEALSAQRCLEWGIVDAVVADERLLPEAEALCHRLLAAPRGSLAAIKRLCTGTTSRPLSEHLALEKSLLEAQAARDDAREGVAAFLARRLPRFDTA
jgi:2-(1,2-epoxy-1,2-dihydrophenyl)acetyl-CoA isomerase